RVLAATVAAAAVGLISAATGLFGGAFAQAPTTQQAFLTFYGWWDNTPPGNGITHPAIHSGAGRKGTFSQPITFASYTTAFRVGTKAWGARVRKYFIMEDD